MPKTAVGFPDNPNWKKILGAVSAIGGCALLFAKSSKETKQLGTLFTIMGAAAFLM